VNTSTQINEEQKLIAAQMITNARRLYADLDDLELVQQATRGIHMMAVAFDIQATFTMSDECDVMRHIERIEAS